MIQIIHGGQIDEKPYVLQLKNYLNNKHFKFAGGFEEIESYFRLVKLRVMFGHNSLESCCP